MRKETKFSYVVFPVPRVYVCHGPYQAMMCFFKYIKENIRDFFPSGDKFVKIKIVSGFFSESSIYWNVWRRDGEQFCENRGKTIFTSDIPGGFIRFVIFYGLDVLENGRALPLLS